VIDERWVLTSSRGVHDGIVTRVVLDGRFLVPLPPTTTDRSTLSSSEGKPMTGPDCRSHTNREFIALPAGYGRRVRSSSVAVGMFVLIVLFFILAVLVYTALSQRDAGDPLWSVSLLTGLVPYPPAIGLLVNLFRVGGRLIGDVVHEPAACGLHAVLGVWWIVLLMFALGALAGQTIGYAHFFADSARPSVSDNVAFVYPILVAVIGTGAYATGRAYLLPSRRALARMWASARRADPAR